MILPPKDELIVMAIAALIIRLFSFVHPVAIGLVLAVPVTIWRRYRKRKAIERYENNLHEW